jgi:hypothetical protein
VIGAGRRRLARMAAAVLCALVARAAIGSDAGTEERLRRRVQRFYVLTYLDRYDEMWDLFAAELRARLGGDRRAYVRQARESGFELYASRIDVIELKGAAASVDVRLDVRLPGSVEVTVRRHRMAWRFEDGEWHYLGSLDVTHAGEATLEGVELLPPPRVATPPYEEPPRSLVPLAPPAARPAAPPDAAGAARASAERWDLVAIPPPGREPDVEHAAAPAPQVEAPASSPSLEAPSMPAAEPVAGPAPPAPAPETKDVQLAVLVNKAVESNPATRNRVLAKLRSQWEPGLAPLMARALPRASAPVAIAFLEQIARYGDGAHADACRPLLDHEDAGVRSAAFEALGEIGSSQHVDVVVAAARRELAQGARAAAVAAAGRLGGGEAAALARDEMADVHVSPGVLASAARAAGVLRDVASEGLLLGLASRLSPPAAVAAAIDALARLRTAAAMEALRRLATSRDVLREVPPAREVRLLALRALAGLGETGAGPALAEHLLRQGQAASASDVALVAACGDPDALVALLPHPHPLVRRRAADFLSRAAVSAEQAERAASALQSALAEEGDGDTLVALDAARLRLLVLAKNDSAVSP